MGIQNKHKFEKRKEEKKKERKEGKKRRGEKRQREKDETLCTARFLSSLIKVGHSFLGDGQSPY